MRTPLFCDDDQLHGPAGTRNFGADATEGHRLVRSAIWGDRLLVHFGLRVRLSRCGPVDGRDRNATGLRVVGRSLEPRGNRPFTCPHRHRVRIGACGARRGRIRKLSRVDQDGGGVVPGPRAGARDGDIQRRLEHRGDRNAARRTMDRTDVGMARCFHRDGRAWLRLAPVLAPDLSPPAGAPEGFRR